MLKTFGFKRIGALSDPVFWGLLCAANKIEPLIDPYVLTDNAFISSLDAMNPAIGVAYYEACEIIQDRTFTDVLLLPFLSVGGAEKYIFEIIKTLEALNPQTRTLIITGEKPSTLTDLERLPKHITIVDMPALAPNLNGHERNLIVLKLIQNCADGARIHIKPSPFAYGFTQMFLKIFKNNKKIFYRFSDEKSGSDYFPIYRNFFTTAVPLLDDVDFLLSDNKNIINNDFYYVGTKHQKWKLLYARQPSHTSPQAIQASNSQPQTRILWASRLDAEKSRNCWCPFPNSCTHSTHRPRLMCTALTFWGILTRRCSRHSPISVTKAPSPTLSRSRLRGMRASFTPAVLTASPTCCWRPCL